MVATTQDKVAEGRVRSIASERAAMPGALLPILNEVQDELGYVPDWSVPIIAEVLNLSRAEVHGVVSFYHLYRKTPPGKQTIYLCRSEACRSMGAEALADSAKALLGIDFHETTEDGRFSLEPIYCLGNCACAPAMMVDQTLLGRVTADQLSKLIDCGEASS